MRELGIKFLCANVLINNIIDTSDHYKYEQLHVSKLLTAQYDIEDVNDRSYKIVADLIHNALIQWWYRSHYNVQIDTIRSEIIEFIRSELIKMDINIIYFTNQYFVVEDITMHQVIFLQLELDKHWRNLEIYSSII